MATPLSISRNSSFTTLHFNHACKSCKTSVVAHAQHTGGLRRSSSTPCLAGNAGGSAATGSSSQKGLVESSGDTCPTEQQVYREHRLKLTSYRQENEDNIVSASNSNASAGVSAVASSTASRSSAVPFGAEQRFASLSRVLLVGQPGAMFRSLANRKWPNAMGPISLLIFLFGTVMALFAAVRGALVRKVKACKCCRGFGVVRCRLCDGRGSVDWRAKFSYSEQCPLCAAKRFVVCPDCGGHYHRRLFNHNKGNKGTLEAFFPSPPSAMTTRSNALD